MSGCGTKSHLTVELTPIESFFMFYLPCDYHKVFYAVLPCMFFCISETKSQETETQPQNINDELIFGPLKEEHHMICNFRLSNLK